MSDQSEITLWSIVVKLKRTRLTITQQIEQLQILKLS